MELGAIEMSPREQNRIPIRECFLSKSRVLWELILYAQFVFVNYKSAVLQDLLQEPYLNMNMDHKILTFNIIP